MNTLRLKLNPFADINTVSLDDQPLSPYSELNNYMKEPFLHWAGQFLDAAEAEINDDYTLEVTAGEFERLFLAGLQNGNEACTSFTTADYAVNISIAERFQNVRQLAIQYGVSIGVDAMRLPVCVQVPIAFDEALTRAVPVNEARLVVTEDPSTARNAVRAMNEGIVIVVSDKNAVHPAPNRSYIWEVPAQELEHVVSSVIDRFVRIPLVASVKTRLAERGDELRTEDQNTLALVTAIDPIVTIAELPVIEVGTCVTLNASVYPESAPMPRLRLIPQNTTILAINGLTISALYPGTTYVEVYRDEENVPFTKVRVSASQNNKVQSIRLALEQEYMGLQHSQQIQVSVLPVDAEDAHEIMWSVDDSRVAIVDSNGVVTAVGEGRAMITASTENATASIAVRVMPNMQRMQLLIDRTELYVGETEPIDVTFVPEHCYDTSYHWNTSDPEVAVIEEDAEGYPIVRAAGIGTCVITCAADEGHCSTSCEILVESTFKKRENVHSMLSVTFVLAIACLVCTVLSFPIPAAVLAVATIGCGIAAMMRNKSDILWSIILMVLAVVLALIALQVIRF